MKSSAGRWLAVFACVAGAGIGLRAIDVVKTQVVDDAPARPEAPRVRLAAMPVAGAPQPFPIDARVLREAVRDGELQVALPDGSTQHVAIERQYTDSTGHWNVVGRTPTRLGKLPMVLTVGANAIFGTLPAPDGGSMYVSTRADGTTQIAAPATNTDGPAPADGSDVEAPPIDAVTQHVSLTLPATAPQIERGAPRRAASSEASKLAPPIAQAPVDTTPVTIDVMGAYTQEQLALRGSIATVETEFANLVAIANQAHIDSGSRVRLRLTSVQATGSFATSITDKAVLDSQYVNATLETQRNVDGADLVVTLRPSNTDGWCGRSYSASPPLRRNATYGEVSVVVANNDGACGPLSFAHEIGHALGAYHDRQTSTVNGFIEQPTYYFAYGHRTGQFSTIMAWPGGGPFLPYFANPQSTLCNGAPCGVDDQADDVRAFNLMAPAIAAYRGTPGTVSIADVEGVEPDYVTNEILVPVRLTGRASQDLTFRVDVIGGTAQADVDYRMPFDNVVRIPANGSRGVLPLSLKPDATIEPDETIQLRLVPIGSTPPIERDVATVTIANDDPRPVVTGYVRFPDGATPPASVGLEFTDFDTLGDRISMTVLPPDWSFTLSPFRGKQLHPKIALPAPFALRIPSTGVNEVRESREWWLMPETGIKVWGYVFGETEDPEYWIGPTTGGVEMTRYESTGSVKELLPITGPGPKFTAYIPVGTLATFRATQTFPNNDGYVYKPGFYGVYDVAAETYVPLIMSSSKPPLNAWPAERRIGDTLGAPVNIDWAMTTSGSFRCTTRDGTAKAGIDYVAMTATQVIPQGAKGLQYCGTLQILSSPPREDLWFEVVISEETNVFLQAQTARVWIPGGGVKTGGPAAAIR